MKMAWTTGKVVRLIEVSDDTDLILMGEKGLIAATKCACGYVFPLYVIEGGVRFDYEGHVDQVCPSCSAKQRIVTYRESAPPRSLSRVQDVVQRIAEAHPCALGTKDPPRRAYCTCSDCARWRSEMDELCSAAVRYSQQAQCSTMPGNMPPDLLALANTVRNQCSPAQLHQVPLFADTADGRGRYCVTVFGCECAWCAGVRASEWCDTEKVLPTIDRLGNAASLEAKALRDVRDAIRMSLTFAPAPGQSKEAWPDAVTVRAGFLQALLDVIDRGTL
jgi:hypothetical protein